MNVDDIDFEQEWNRIKEAVSSKRFGLIFSTTSPMVEVTYSTSRLRLGTGIKIHKNVFKVLKSISLIQIDYSKDVLIYYINPEELA